MNIKHNKSGLYIYIIIFFYFISFNGLYAQDIHFSQFTQSPQLINPAMIAISDIEWEVNLNYRKQWVSIGCPYTTYHSSFQMPLFRKREKSSYLGVGLNAYRDIAGDSKFGTTQTSLSVSGILPIDKYNTFSAGIQGGVAQKSVNLNDLIWGNQFNGQSFDLSIPSNEQSSNNFVYPDLAYGLFYEYFNAESPFIRDYVFKINLGVAHFHANKPAQNFYSSAERLLSKWAFYTFLQKDIPETQVSFITAAVYFRQGPNTEINLGSLLRFRIKEDSKYTGYYKESGLFFGCFYRLNDAIIPKFFIEIRDYAIGISYDINLSSLTELTHGHSGIEVSFKYGKPKTIW